MADPRTGFDAHRKHFQSAGHYGVVPWDDPAYAVTGKAKHDTGRWSVSDPRPYPDVQTDAQALPELRDRDPEQMELFA